MIDTGQRQILLRRRTAICAPVLTTHKFIQIMSSWEDLQALGLLAMRNGPCMLTETATYTNIIYVAGIFVQYFEMRLRDSGAEALR